VFAAHSFCQLGLRNKIVTLDVSSSLPLRFRVLNAVGKTLRAIGVAAAELDEKSMCRAAVRQTGLSDFGDSYFREGLVRLLDSATRDVPFHFVGRLMFSRWIVNHLANRLLLEETRKQRPELLDHSLVPPIVILGMPRSGTTLLHRLLAIDPAHRGVPLWELVRPILPPDGRRDRRRQIAERHFRVGAKLTPDVDRKHYIRVNEPEECMWMLGMTFVNLSFWMLAPVYGYVDWYNQQELFPQKYREYRWLLSVLQASAPTRRLVLKAPEHSAALDCLVQAVPEALIIQTHRDPVVVVNSLNSLFRTVHAGRAERIDPRRTAETNLELLECSSARNLAARNECARAIRDVRYEQLVADPIGTVRGVYRAFGLEWPPGHEKRLEAYIGENPKHKHGQHRYRAEDFGLTNRMIAARLQQYAEAFGYRNSV
jgi:hypothetical protein